MARCPLPALETKATPIPRGKALCRLSSEGVIYHLWMQRNNLKHRKRIVREIRARMLAKGRFQRRMHGNKLLSTGNSVQQSNPVGVRTSQWAFMSCWLLSCWQAFLAVCFVWFLLSVSAVCSVFQLFADLSSLSAAVHKRFHS